MEESEMDLKEWLEENTYEKFIKKNDNIKYYFDGTLIDFIFSQNTEKENKDV